jgi:aminopeptidase N
MDRIVIAGMLAGVGLVAGVAFGQTQVRGSALTGEVLDEVPQIAPPFCGCGKSRALWERARAGLPINDGEPGAASREASTATDLISNDLDIEITPTGASIGFITGSNTMRVRSLVNGLTQFTFRLRSQFNVTSVTLNGSTPATATTPGANSYGRTVTLDRAYNIDEEFTVRIVYNGTAVSRGFGSIEFTQQFAGGPALVSSLSEAYYAATWWPTKDGDVFLPGDNSDKAVGSIAITAPSTYQTVSQGLLTSVTPVAGGKTKYRWTTNYPTAPYLFSISTSVYNQWSQTYTYPLPGGGTGSMPVQFSIYPSSDTPANRAAWEKCIPMLEAFREPFGEYPFVNEKYGMYQFPFGGGMEHQTYSGMGGFWESVVAHELAHQWWGDDVTCKTWNDIWLNEGFAAYAECIWEERKPGSSGLPALRAAINARRPSAVNDSVYCYATDNMSRLFSSTFTYDKGAWVMHQLRGVVGDALFYNILREFRAAYSGSGATTNDFRDLASAVAGTDLTTFFQQCVFGIGAPSYTSGWQNATINGQNYLRLVINQTQDTSWGANSKFEFPIDVEITTSTGTSTVVLQNTARTQHYLVPITGSATAVALDPLDWILIQSKTNVAYTNGPAKIVASSPSPGSTLTQAPATVSVIFSEPVSASAGAFTLTGPTGTVSTTFSYNATTRTATLTPTATLAAGSYTLSVADSIITTASAMALDGEWTGSLPTGNGIAGGPSALAFAIGSPACPADIDNGTGLGLSDNAVDVSDLLFFLSEFENGSVNADLDDDGVGLTGTPDGGVDVNDLLFFLARFEAGC